MRLYIQAASYIHFIPEYMFTLLCDYIRFSGEGVVLVAVWMALKSPATSFPPPVCGVAVAILSVRLKMAPMFEACSSCRGTPRLRQVTQKLYLQSGGASSESGVSGASVAAPSSGERLRLRP